MAVSDLALIQPLPEKLRSMVEALVGCVAGAVLVAETEEMARQTGLADIRLERKSEYIDQMVSWNDPLYQQIVEALPAGSKVSDYITSLYVSAVKPGRCCCQSCS